jgi:hypothetical protein
LCWRVDSLQFRRTNRVYNLDWHPAPRRQPFFAFALPMGARPDIQARIDLGGI